MFHTGFFVVLSLVLLGVAIWFGFGYREARRAEHRMLEDHLHIVDAATKIEHALPFNDSEEGKFKLAPRDALDALTNEHWSLHCARTNAILAGHTRKEGTE